MTRPKKGRDEPLGPGRVDEEEGGPSNDRIVYKQIELCYQAVPSWGKGEVTKKPIWHGLRQKPYAIPRKKETFYGIFKQFGIDLLNNATSIYSEKYRRQVLDIQRLRDSMNFVLNNISTGKICNYCKQEFCECEFKIYSSGNLWGDSKIYINNKECADGIRLSERTKYKTDPDVSRNQVCNVLKNWAVTIDRVVALLFFGTSRGRHDVNLFNKICRALDKFGSVPPNSCESVIYLAVRPGTHNKYVGQTRRGLVRRKKEHVESLSKLDKGKYNSCKMYNDPRAYHKYIFIEVISLGDTIIRHELSNVEGINNANFGWGDNYVSNLVEEKFKSEAATHRIENATNERP